MLEEFDYEIIHKPGKQNCVADGLLRIRIENENNINTEINMISNETNKVENSSLDNNADDQSNLTTIHSADTDDITNCFINKSKHSTSADNQNMYSTPNFINAQIKQ